MFSSPLQRALRRGLADGGDLQDELRRLDDYTVKSASDAKAIISALRRLPNKNSSLDRITSPLHSLAGLFQSVDGRDCPAFDVLRDEGTPELIRIIRELQTQSMEDVSHDLLFVLKILALYGTHAGAQQIVDSARHPFEPDGFLWNVILTIFTPRHPESAFVFEALSNPLPPGFIAVSLLDAANNAAGEGELQSHPFDSEDGEARLRAWLTNENPDEFSFARSATRALPFLEGQFRDELLGLAREHTDTETRIDAAWASAKIGQDIGLQMLSEFCLDPNYAASAISLLEDLGREDVIPEKASDPDFQATAAFANWLSHPNELGRPPDELHILDKRELHWPPTNEVTQLWLIKYVVHDEYGLEADDVDCGLVGSTIWCFFLYQMHRRPPEDCYAIHCCWELDLMDSPVEDAAEYAILIDRWPHAPLSNARVTHVMEIPQQLGLDSRLVALATAMMNGEEGWAVLDGAHSRWYPAADFPEPNQSTKILDIHVGRRLLGFDEVVDRKRYLGNAASEPTTEQFVDAYETLLRECEQGTVDRKQQLLADWKSPLGKHLQKYAESCEQVGRESQAEAIAKTFEKLVDALKELPPASMSDAFGFSGLVSQAFENYVETAVQLGRRNQVAKMIEFFEPHWNDTYGHGQLGMAAFKTGKMATAERLLKKIREQGPNWRRAKEMSVLARLWHQQRELDKAHELLVDCLQGLTQEAQTATGSDIEIFDGWYQNHRRTFLELFPEGANTLNEKGLPESMLPSHDT